MLNKVHRGSLAVGILMGAAGAVWVAGGLRGRVPPTDYPIAPLPKPGLAAEMDGESISEARLIGDALEPWYQIEQRIYEFKVSRVDQLLFEKALLEVASRAKMNPGEYANKEIYHEPISASEGEVLAYLNKRNLSKDLLSKPEEAEKLKRAVVGEKRNALKAQFLAKEKAKHKIQVFFTPARPSANWIPVGTSPEVESAGPGKSKGTLVGFVDYQCPGSAKSFPVLEDLAIKYGLKVVLKHLPLETRKGARPAALAALCAFKQGGASAYLSFSGAAFKAQKDLPQNIGALAEGAHLDVAKLNACREGSDFNSQLEEDQATARDLNVRGTPQFFLNGRHINLLGPADQLQKQVGQILEKSPQ